MIEHDFSFYDTIQFFIFRNFHIIVNNGKLELE